MRVAVIGSGYVGLVSGACFAEFGARVACVDRDAGRVRSLEQGVMPIYEPGLEALVARNLAAGRLSFTGALAPAVRTAELVFIAVGTPSRPGDGYADLIHVEAATREIAAAMSGYTLIVTKSTVPVGTGRRLRALIRAQRPEADFDVAANPEFMREGSAVEDFMTPDRLVLGTEGGRALELLSQLYRPLRAKDTPILCTDLETAELIKYAANAFLATRVTFINEMADLCEKLGADVETLACGIGLDKRIGQRFLRPGPGFGGACFPKDTRALAAMAAMAGAPLRTLEAVIEANALRKEAMAERILRALGDPAGRTAAVLGVTFKAGTDDMREAPSLEILPRLQAAGVALRAYDPVGRKNAEPLLPGVTWCDDAYAAMAGADVLVILTEWEEFRALDWTRVRSLLRRPRIVDLRNLCTTAEMHAAGLEYHSIGRSSPAAAPEAAVRQTGTAAE